MEKNNQTKADFWDLGEYVPKSRRPIEKSYDVSSVEISFGSPSENKKEDEPIPRPADGERIRKARELLRETELIHGVVPVTDRDDRKAEFPENKLIAGIITTAPYSGMEMHARFIADAKKFDGLTEDECPFAQFFSYSPMYSQLSPEQKRYYFYWRSAVKRGEFPKTEYSYVLLLISETVTLSDRHDKKNDLTMLCRLWKEYASQYTLVKRLLPVWISDYCIVNGISPDGEAKNIMGQMSVPSHPDVTAFCTGFGDRPVQKLILASSPHSWRDSGAVTDENRKYFEKLADQAVIDILVRCEENRLPPFDNTSFPVLIPEKLSRTAFSGLVCPTDMKWGISVSHLSVSRLPFIRTEISEMVKCAENHIRRLIGIRSRYHVSNMKPAVKQLFEEWFSRFESAAVKQKTEERPEYEKLYDAPSQTLSAEEAKSIERLAWKTTALLTDNPEFGYEPDEEPEGPGDEACVPSGADAVTVRVIKALLGLSEESFASICADLKCLPDTLADNTNELLFDHFGDSVIESGENGYIIDCYRDEAARWLEENT